MAGLGNLSAFRPGAACPLGPSSTCFTAPNVPSGNTAPFEPSDIEPLVAILMECPSGSYSSRVFQQHHRAGTCWNDSLFMILFQADFMKPVLPDHIKFFCTAMLDAGYTDLVYSIQAENTYENWKGETVTETITDYYKKISTIAQRFRKEIDYGLPLQFWEFYCLALQRYILLGYLFLKKPEEFPANVPLYKRRPSLAESNFTKIHILFKDAALSMMNTGLYCSNFQPLKAAVAEFIQAATGGQMKMLEFSDKPADKQAIYLGIARKHVVSFFQCGGVWYLYDNDIGITSIEGADGAKLKEQAFKDLKIRIGAKRDSIEYEAILETDTVVVSIPFEPSTRYSAGELLYDDVEGDYSFCIGHS